MHRRQKAPTTAVLLKRILPARDPHSNFGQARDKITQFPQRVRIDG